MHLQGLLSLGFFYSCWLGSILLLPLSLFLAAMQISFIPLYIYMGYIGFRIIQPLKQEPWPFVQQFLSMDDAPYCRSAKLVFDKDASIPKDDSRTVVAVAPHGILCVGWGFLISSKQFFGTKIKFLVADMLFYLPFIRDVLAWTSCSSASGGNIKRLMKRGDNIGLIPGGFQEASLYSRGRHRVFLKSRKGIIKYCLQYGYKVQPVYSFGEELTYRTLPLAVGPFKKMCLWLNTMDIPTTIFFGKFGSFMPLDDIDLTVVIGEPISFPQIADPTPADLEKHLAVMIAAFQDLFDRYKGKYAATGEAAELEIM